MTQANWACVEQVFEPRDAGEVEVVGGLVEQQDVGCVTMASAMARRLRQPPERRRGLGGRATGSRCGRRFRAGGLRARRQARPARSMAASRTSRTVMPGAKVDSCLT